MCVCIYIYNYVMVNWLPKCHDVCSSLDPYRDGSVRNMCVIARCMCVCVCVSIEFFYLLQSRNVS
jgi:hypothetical protein